MARLIARKILIALTAGVLIGLIGLFGKFAGYPWLIASLGPTAALQLTMPTAPMSRPWNVAAGHLLALGAAFAALYATGAMHAPPFSDSHSLSLLRVAAAAFAVALGLALEFAFKASHASGAATALLVTLGLIPPDWEGVIVVVVGVALVTVLGEAARQARLRWMGG